MSNQKDSSVNHGMKPLRGIEALCNPGHSAQRGDRFGRMFPLAPLFIQAQQLKALGKQCGPMDMENHTKERTTTVPVGQIFFGQFVDHDITLDVSSSLGSAVSDVSSIENVRTPALDLDCVYGQGPEASPYLYYGKDAFKGIKLLTGAEGTAYTAQATEFANEDLFRSPHGVAVIGDPRNDENRVISQMQLAMIRFHNKVVDSLAEFNDEGELLDADLFEHARQLTTWHYQWAVLHDYLPAICGQAVVSDILGNGRKFYCAEFSEPFIPVEFSVAAYRFGHSMIPQIIKIKSGEVEHKLFSEVMGMGFKPLKSAEGIVDWNVLFSTAQEASVQMAEKLDSKLATDLLKLPFIDEAKDESSLATRNLLRGQTFMLPSGENVARCMHRPDAEIHAVHEAACSLAGETADLRSGTPLWLYLLVEAEQIGRESSPGEFDKGEGLGPVGARIIAETIHGLISLDPRSFLSQQPNWNPADGLGLSSVGEILTYESETVAHA